MVCVILLLVDFVFAAKVYAEYDTARAQVIPWSGYWWPSQSGGLANGYHPWGRPAPLEKYELYTTGRYPGAATQWELENFYDPDALSWYGQCHAFAAAAAFEAIDFKPSSINNIIFRVGDKKGLLTACHGSDPAIRDSGSDPKVFHEWLLTYIKDQGKAFVADLGGPSEAWFYPVYKYEMQTTVVAGGRLSVTCLVYYADDHVQPDFQGTREEFAGFTYDLFLAGDVIIGGEWTGGSVGLHPKSIFLPLAAKPTSPYLDYNVVRTLARHQDDFLESPEPATLWPGNYNLVLLNPDVYRLECNPGDKLIFTLQGLDQPNESKHVLITDADQQTVYENTFSDTLEFAITAERPPYTLTISMADYQQGAVYNLNYDLVAEHSFWVPKTYGDQGWDGFALTNTSQNQIDSIVVTTYDAANKPLSTIQGPLTLAPGQKQTLLLGNMNIRLHEKGLIHSVKIISPEKIDLLYLGSGNNKAEMNGFADTPAETLIIVPDTSRMFDSRKYVTWGLINQSKTVATAELINYNAGGERIGRTQVTIPGPGMVAYTPSNNPFYASVDEGWVMITSSEKIKGVIQWSNDRLGGKESMYALSAGGDCLVLPHVAGSSPWVTEITLMNMAGMDNSVEFLLTNGDFTYRATRLFAPNQKQVLKVMELFPDLSGAVLDQAALILQGQGDLTGYFTYAQGASSASFPLMARKKLGSGFTIPHIAADNIWWTGIALFNAGQEKAIVTLTPYDAEGNPVTEAIHAIELSAFAKTAFEARTIWNEAAIARISWIHVHTTVNQAIAGLFLFGSNDMKLLSGADLYPLTVE